MGSGREAHTPCPSQREGVCRFPTAPTKPQALLSGEAGRAEGFMQAALTSWGCGKYTGMLQSNEHSNRFVSQPVICIIDICKLLSQKKHSGGASLAPSGEPVALLILLLRNFCIHNLHQSTSPVCVLPLLTPFHSWCQSTCFYPLCVPQGGGPRELEPCEIIGVKIFYDKPMAQGRKEWSE